jgi:hypothetical protein
MNTMTRRRWFALALSGVTLPWVACLAEAEVPWNLPTEVAGIPLPRSNMAVRAAQFARRSCPEYLFNHCMRTFLFGALALKQQRLTFDADDAFVAAALHDLGLLPAFASPAQSFEADGADAAERFALENGLGAAHANVIWHGVVLHDGRFSITRRAGPEAMLVALGAGADVDGPELNTDDQKRQMAEVVAAFPRLHFKQHFTALLVDQCHRKPLSQRGTWLEGLCRRQVPEAWKETVEQEIAAAPFDE